MCVPQTLAALQTLSTASQILSTPRESKYQQALAHNNQILAERQAAEERRIGQLEANKRRVQTDIEKSRQRNALASMGVDTSSGTALDILQDTAEAGEIEARDVLRNAQMRAYNQDLRANSFESSAAYQKRRGQNAFGQDLINGGTTILTGFGKGGGRGLLRY